MNPAHPATWGGIIIQSNATLFLLPCLSVLPFSLTQLFDIVIIIIFERKKFFNVFVDFISFNFCVSDYENFKADKNFFFEYKRLAAQSICEMDSFISYFLVVPFQLGLNKYIVNEGNTILRSKQYMFIEYRPSNRILL